MENRFGFKDLIHVVLLIAVLVSIWLAMRQDDRQQQLLMQIRDQLQGVTGDTSRVRQRLDQLIAEGLAVRSGDAEADPAQADPFARIRKAQENPDYARGDYYIDVFALVPDRLTPLVSSDAYSSEIQSYVIESLAQRDPDTLAWGPKLATGWRITENREAWQAYVDERLAAPLTEAEVRQEPDFPSEDPAAQAAYLEQRLEEGRRLQDVVREAEAPSAVTIEFDLRGGVTFSDGEPLSADDVIFTFGWIMNPAVEAPRARAYFEKIKAVRKVDEDTVAFDFREPYFQAFELAGSMEILPEHFYGRLLPTEFNRSTGLLLGSGPYRLPDPRSWRPEPGKPIELLRNDRYWGEPAPFDRLIWRVIENESARLTTFQNGDIDLLGPTPEQYVGLLKDQALVERTQHFEYQAPTAGYAYIAWNQRRGGQPTLFADKRVRQAMTLLVNRQRIIDEIYLGYGQVVSGPFSPLVPQSNPDIEPWPYDTARALALLKEAGFADRDGDGVVESAGGQPLAFKLAYLSTNETYSRVVLFLKDTFARAGVIIEPQPLEWSVLLERMDQRDFDAVSLGWTGSIEGDPYQIFHSSQITGTGDNFVAYRNPQLDRLIEQARSTVEEKERMPLWHQVHAILHEDQPYTFLFTRQSLVFLDGRLKNVQRVSLGLNPILEWYVPADQRKWAK